jgi:hypothetical protein
LPSKSRFAFWNFNGLRNERFDVWGLMFCDTGGELVVGVRLCWCFLVGFKEFFMGFYFVVVWNVWI